MKPRRDCSPRSLASRSASQAPPEWMPTMAASGRSARAARTCSSSLRYRLSASKCASSGGVGMVVKVLLQNDGGGLGVDYLAAFGLDHGRRIALVDQLDRQVEAAVQLVGEAARAQGHVVLGAVRMARLAHDQPRGTPWFDQ